MSILKLNTKSSIADIVNNIPGGVYRNYILDSESNKRLDVMVCFTQKLVIQNITPFIEVKFPSKYSAREKRIEVVGITDSKIFLYKFSDWNRFDKDAIELDRNIVELVSLFGSSNVSFIGILLLNSSCNIDFIQQQVNNLGLNIDVNYY